MLMTNHGFEFNGEVSSNPEFEDIQILLAETILETLRLGDELKKDNATHPSEVQYQIALAAENIPSIVRYPADIEPLIDADDINMIIVTYVFQYLSERPYLELRIEKDDTIFATFSKPGIDENEPYSGSVVANGKEYQTLFESDEITDVFDQIVLPSLDGIPIGDPQNPSQARSIIDRLIETQNADSIESHRYEIKITDGARQGQTFKIQLHRINDASHEIEIESVLEDSMSFDSDLMEPIAEYCSIIATLNFDSGQESGESFMQSIEFVAINPGESAPVKLPSDSENLTALKRDIDLILAHIKDRTEEVGLNEDQY